MRIEIIKTNERFKKGQNVKVTRALAKKLIKDGIAVAEGSIIEEEEKENVEPSNATEIPIVEIKKAINKKSNKNKPK